MRSLLHDIPQFFILFLEELFYIFNQILSIRLLGRRDFCESSPLRKLNANVEMKPLQNGFVTDIGTHVS